MVDTAAIKQQLQAQNGGETILEKATVFVEEFALHQPATFKQKIPTVETSQQVAGGTLTEKVENGVFIATWVPNP